MNISYRDATGKSYEYEESFWTGKKKLTIDGVEATKVSKKEFMAGDVHIQLKGSFITGVQLVTQNETIVLCQNKWYEWILILLPFLVLFPGIFGGAIGGGLAGLFGASASIFNATVLRGNKNIAAKVAICILAFIISFLAWFGLYLIIVGGLASAFPSLRN